jgi:phage-related protein
MTGDQRSIASFVVRFTQHLWKDPQEEPHLQWRGHIRHVQSDQEAHFSDLNEVLSFIRQQLTQLTMEATEGITETEREKVLDQSFKLWEKLASSYSEMVSEAMVQTFNQSESFKKEVDTAVTKALQAWGSPVESESAAIANAIEKISNQVQALANKIDMLEKGISGRDSDDLK